MLQPLAQTGLWQHLKAAQLTLQHAAQLLQHASKIDHSCNSTNSCIKPPFVPANSQQHGQQLAQQQTYQHSAPQLGHGLWSLLLQDLRLWPAQQRHHQQQHQLCQLRHYHPATHAARTLTQKLMQQRTWQELRLLFDASGGGGRLNPIQLCALLQHLARLAPAPELLSATERGELRGFAHELVATCMSKVHRLDAVGLSNMISSALKLGCTLPLHHHHHPQQQPQQEQQQQRQHPQEGSGGDGYIYAELLSAATKQVAHANAHAAGMLLAALANLQQQQQQQQQQLGALQQQLDLWCSFASALSRRLQACAAVQQLSSEDASKLCSTVSRLSGLLVKQRTAAASALAAADAFQQQQQTPAVDAAFDVLEEFESDMAEDPSFEPADFPAEMQPGTEETTVSPLACVTWHPEGSSITTVEQLQQLQQQYTQLQQQLRALLSLAAQQVEQQASLGAAAATPAATGGSLADISRVLYALAKTWAWPGWPAVLGLLQQYSTGVQSAQLFAAAAAAAAHSQQGRSGKRGSKSRRQQQQMAGCSPGMLSHPGLGFTGGPGGGVYGGSVVEDESAEVLTAVRESLPPAIWAAGRLAEQQLQQLQRQRQKQQLLQELQQHQQLWTTVSPVLAVIQQQLGWLGPLQLAQVATGLGKLVHSSMSLVQLAAPHVHVHALGKSPPGAGNVTSSGALTAGEMDVSAAAAAAAAAAAGGAAEAARAAEALNELLAGPELRRLLQQHVARVEALLPLLALQHRLQLAAAYDQLGLALPRSVSVVFERDAAQQQGVPTA